MVTTPHVTHLADALCLSQHVRRARGAVDDVVRSMAEEVQVLFEVVTDGHQRAATQLSQERLELVDHGRPRLRQFTQSAVTAAHGLHTKNDIVHTYVHMYKQCNVYCTCVSTPVFSAASATIFTASVRLSWQLGWASRGDSKEADTASTLLLSRRSSTTSSTRCFTESPPSLSPPLQVSTTFTAIWPR